MFGFIKRGCNWVCNKVMGSKLVKGAIAIGSSCILFVSSGFVMVSNALAETGVTIPDLDLTLFETAAGKVLAAVVTVVAVCLAYMIFKKAGR